MLDQSITLTDKDIERFWSKVDRSGECWRWTAGVDRRGYGRFWLNGRTLRASHVAWTIANGSMPEGKFALHKCDNPPCVRPSHLFCGTAADNIADMVSKGRHSHGDTHWSRKYPELRPRGERNGAYTKPENRSRGEARPAAKLTEDTVREIRRRHFEEGASKKALAREYGVSRWTVRGILAGRAWKHVA